MNQLQSERLSYRLMDETDTQALFDVDQDPKVMEFLNDSKPHSMQEITEKMMPRMMAYRNATEGWGIWHVSLTETGEYLGWILVRPMHFFTENEETQWHEIELGWRFFAHTWGKGYATESAAFLAAQQGAKDSVTKLTAIADEENVASTRVMEKIGMKFIKKALHKDPLFEEELVYYSMDV